MYVVLFYYSFKWEKPRRERESKKRKAHKLSPCLRVVDRRPPAEISFTFTHFLSFDFLPKNPFSFRKKG
jgi:hypothetical protein